MKGQKMINVVLREITQCNDEQKKAVRVVRNQLSVRRSMYTEHEIQLEEHLAWIERISSDNRHIVFLVLIDEIVSGVVSVNAIDRLHLKSDWAFYLAENARGGLGVALELKLLNFVFYVLGLEKLNCEVIEKNVSVVKLHEKFGFKKEGFRQEHIIKNGLRIGVFFLGLTKSSWAENADKFSARYKKVIDKFNIEIQYENR